MALPVNPPKYSSWAALVAPIKVGSSGWPVYALQAALGTVGRDTNPDGVFGPKTKRQVTGFQENNGLASDGIAGGKTQAKLIAKISGIVHEAVPDLPDGLLRGYAEAEGANVLAATNWFTPAGGAPGVDCGVVQWRQWGPPFDLSGLKDAFNCRRSLMFAANILLGRVQDYRRRRPSLNRDQVLRAALLAHNAPFLAEQIVRNGRLSTPTKLATWTVKPGGGHYTHAEWYRVYTDKLLKYT